MVCFVCGRRSKEAKKLLTEEHTFEEVLKIALGREAAEKDVAAFCQVGSASINNLDAGIRQPYHPSKRRKGPGKAGLIPG